MTDENEALCREMKAYYQQRQLDGGVYSAGSFEAGWCAAMRYNASIEPVEYPSSPQVTPPKYDPSWHGSQAHTFVTDKSVGSEVKPRTGDKWFTYEDQLPADMPKEDYAAWYAKSWIIGGLGVRVGPVYPSDAKPRTGDKQDFCPEIRMNSVCCGRYNENGVCQKCGITRDEPRTGEGS